MKTVRLFLYPLLLNCLLTTLPVYGQVTTTITLISPHTVCANHTGDITLEWTTTDSGNQQGNYELRMYSSSVTSVNANTASLQRINLNATYIQTTNPRKLRATIPAPSLGNGSKSRFAIFNRVLTNTVNNVSNVFEILPAAGVVISGSSTVQAGNAAQVLLTFSGAPPFTYEYNNYTPQDIANNYASRSGSSQSLTQFLSIVVPLTNQIPFPYDNRYVRNIKDALGCTGSVSGASQITIAKFTLNTSVSRSSLCAGANLTVSYSLANANVVLQPSFRPRILLSDASGSFNNPTQIGDGTVGNSQVNVTIPTTVTPGSGYRIQVVAVNSDENLYLIPASTPISITRADRPDITTPASPCQGGNNVTLQASGSGTLNWYDFQNNRLPGTPIQTTGNAGTFGYKVSQTINGCESDRVEVLVTVKPKSSAPTTNQNLTYCQNQGADQLSANGPNLIWYDASRNSLGSTAPRPTTTGAGPQTFYVSRDDNGCRSDLTEIKVTVNGLPQAPVVSSPSAVCQYKEASVLTASGPELRWYRQASGGNSEGAIRPATGQPGTTTFWVSQVINNCEGPRSPVEQRVNEASPDPTVSSPLPLCRDQVSTGLTATGQGLRWYDSGNTFLGTDGPRPPTGQVRDITYRVSQTNNSANCESRLVDLVVQVRDTPGKPTVSDKNVCNNAPALTLSAQGDGIRWYTTETEGSGSETAPQVATGQVGDKIYWVSQRFGICEGPRAKLVVHVLALPLVPTPNAPGPVCQYKDVPVLTASGTELRWYRQASGGNSENTIKPASDQAGTTTFWVSQVVNGCEGERTPLNQVINPASPVPTIATLPVLLCRDQALTSLTATGQNLRWYDQNNTALGTTAPQPPTGQVRDLLYRVSQTSNSVNCESALVDIPVQVRDRPGAPTVGPLSLCQNQTAQPLRATGDGLAWYEQATGGTPTTTLVPQTAILGERTYWVAQRFGICEGPRAPLVTTVYAVPAAPTATDRTYCIGDQPTALTATGDNLRWYEGNSPAKASIVPPTSTGQSLTYMVTQTRNGCESAGKTVSVRILARATVRMTGDSVSLLSDSTAIRLRFGGDAPWRVRLWDGQTLTTSSNPLVRWVKPLQPGTATYTIQALDNECGAGQILNAYRLVVFAPLATEPLLATATALQAYPVPASQDLTVEWLAPKGVAVTLQLSSLDGRLNWQVDRQGTGNRQTERVDLRTQAGGVLILKLLAAGYSAKSITLIKQ